VNKEYFGSVRFYKNLILLLVIILIAVPTILFFVYKSKYNKLLTQVESAETTQTSQEAEETEPETDPRYITVQGENGETITMVIGE